MKRSGKFRTKYWNRKIPGTKCNTTHMSRAKQKKLKTCETKRKKKKRFSRGTPKVEQRRQCTVAWGFENRWAAKGVSVSPQYQKTLTPLQHTVLSISTIFLNFTISRVTLHIVLSTMFSLFSIRRRGIIIRTRFSLPSLLLLFFINHKYRKIVIVMIQINNFLITKKIYRRWFKEG